MTRARDLGDFIADGAAAELVVDTTTLVVDSTNNRVGIGTASPSQALDVVGNLTVAGGAVFNENSADVDFRVESNGNANMLFVDGGEDKVFIGHNTTHQYDAYGAEIILQIEAAGTAPYAGIGMIQNSNDADSAPLIFGKSRGTSVGSTTIVQDGDLLGRIEFQGMDGGDLETGASIFGMVDGTPGSDDMPGRLVFNTTADGANSATERMRIDSGGNVGVNCAPNNYSANHRSITLNGPTTPIIDLEVNGTRTGSIVAESTKFDFNAVTSVPIRLLTADTERFRIGTSGQLGIGGATYGTAGQVLTSGGSGAAPTWADTVSGGTAFSAF